MEDAVRRAYAMMLADFDVVTERNRETAKSMFKYVGSRCESPIEILMLGALAYGLERTVRSAWENVHIRAQDEIGPYRADFSLTYNSVKVIVECDGHDFHNISKEQAQRDRERDRYFQTVGWSVLRFTGSEIVRDPAACADQVGAFFCEQANRTTDPGEKPADG